ncbi:MAG: hypothetical protein COA37_16825 [Hoeflea sp.]|nr:MAG: hypothetical protein COA37_16825 [Hoeflea sp.]
MRVVLMHAAFKGVRMSGNIYAALKFTQPLCTSACTRDAFASQSRKPCIGKAPAVAAARQKPETSHVSQKLLLTVFIYICRIMPCQT